MESAKMAIAPERELQACMRVIRFAVLDARAAAWQSEVNAERLADLMDAIHNIPGLILHWDACDQDVLKRKLLAFERKWKDDGPCLRTIYEQALEDDGI
jgi:hypothetical protein